MRRTLTVLVFIALCRSPLLGQDFCTSTETIGQYWERLTRTASESNKMSAPQAQGEAAAETEDQLNRKATGLDATAVAPASAIQDFLPLLRLALVGKGLQSNGDVKALDFERKLTFLEPKLVELKLKGTRNDPDIYEPLKMKFAEDVRDEQVAQLKEKLEDFDDYSVTLSGNLKTKGFSRSWNEKAQEVFATLFSKLVTEADFEKSDLANREFRRIVAEANVTEVDSLDRIPSCARRLEVQARLVAAASAFKKDVAGLKALAESRGIFRVADLVNNQPQINGSAGYRVRRGLTGPTEWSLKANWEVGFENLNKMLDKCGQDQQCWADYVKNASAPMENGNRWTFSAEYKHHQAFQALLPANSIDLDLPAGKSLMISATYGRYFEAKALGDGSSRIDLKGEYQDVSDDPTRQDRGVVSLTYSNRFLKSMGASLGISYANHAEFLPKTDHQVSAHFGISYRLLPDKESGK